MTPRNTKFYLEGFDLMIIAITSRGNYEKMRGISWLAAKFTVSFSRRTLLHGVSK
jgi:hypothetical protein